MRNIRLCAQLGENRREINAARLTLNQRVSGSSPAAPTIQVAEFIMDKWQAK
jgi:hypothetical protein